MSEWLSSKRQKIRSVSEDVGKRLLRIIAAATMENSMGISQKTKNRTVIRSHNSTSGYFSEENENVNSKI